jgi:hypothetical protein
MRWYAEQPTKADNATTSRAESVSDNDGSLAVKVALSSLLRAKARVIGFRPFRGARQSAGTRWPNRSDRNHRG